MAPEDCTGCTLCVEVCPAKSKSEVKHKAINMAPQPPLREAEARQLGLLPEDSGDRPHALLSLGQVKDVQLLQPLFEFSGACSGCGETPYIKLMTQLFGDRALIANATGCSSIYGGNLPTTPYCRERGGPRPGVVELAVRRQRRVRRWACAWPSTSRTSTRASWCARLGFAIGEELAQAMLNADQNHRSRHLRAARAGEAAEGRSWRASTRREARDLLSVADALVKKSVWIVGGDGWAYDIGYGGLDHVLASGRNVNILVLDTEVYSNTGGQMSKSTPRGAVAKFAAGGKPRPRKTWRMMAMSYGSVYVAQVAMGASDMHTLKAFLEAEAYDGPSLIIAYSHCIAHGYDLVHGMDQQKAAVQFRLLAAVPLQSRPGGAGQESVPAGFAARPSLPLEELHLQRNPLHHAGQEQSGRGQAAAETGARKTCQPLEALRAHGPPAGRTAPQEVKK